MKAQFNSMFEAKSLHLKIWSVGIHCNEKVNPWVGHVSACCQMQGTVDSTKSTVHHPGLSYLVNFQVLGKYQPAEMYVSVRAANHKQP